MLQVSPLSAARGAYYLADLAAELRATRAGDPERERTGRTPSGDPRLVGRWTGQTAANLGLTGSVCRTDLEAVLHGSHPRSGQPLRRSGSVAGYDLTFTAPKSVSVLFATGGPEIGSAVVAAHESAVEAALRYVEGRAVGVRRGSGEERGILGTDGVAAASFTHGTSRALIPHLHTHVVVANVARGADQRWTAIDGRGLYAHRGAAGGLYDAHLRDALSTSIGVDWSPSPHGYEISGIDPIVLGAFSGRAAEIRQHLAERPARSGRAGRVAWAATRESKAPDHVRNGLPVEWAERANRLGFGRDELGAVTGRRVERAEGLDEHVFAAGVLGSTPSSITRRDLVEAWSRALPRGAPSMEVDASVDHWAPSGTERGVAERSRPVADVVPRSYLLRVLGPRPVSAGDQPVWQEAARSVDGYRARWNVSAREEALGVVGGGPALSRLPARRLADHLTTQGRIDESRRRLGRDLAREVETQSLGFER